jgi:hypothetical protein
MMSGSSALLHLTSSISPILRTSVEMPVPDPTSIVAVEMLVRKVERMIVISTETLSHPEPRARLGSSL